eukprot:4237388-Amphidinium_carterae.1
MQVRPPWVVADNALRRLQATEVKLRPGLQVRPLVELRQVKVARGVRVSHATGVTKSLRKGPTSRWVPSAHPG